MSSSGNNLMRWFRGASSQAKPDEGGKSAPRTRRTCIGLGEFMRNLTSSSEQKMCVLDLGPTSPTNIALLTEMGIRVYNEDILSESQDANYSVKQEDGSLQIDTAKFFTENLDYSADQFDAILFWDVADYLPESLVKPLVERLQAMLKSKGHLLAFFHTKDAGHAGETSARLNLVAAWREATVFTDAERAALELAEQGTRIADAAGGVTDEAWANAAKHYDTDQLAALVCTIALINTALNLSRTNKPAEQRSGSSAN